MKFLLKSLVVFIVTFNILKFVIFFFNTGHTVNYNIGNFNIKETLSTKDDNNYYFSIDGEKSKINFQIKENYNKSEKIIKKIYYKKIGSYKCILPVFKNEKILTDVMCLKDDTIYYAHDLDNKDIFNKFKKYGYNPNLYKDTASGITLSNTQIIYKDNLPENDYIAIESYKGLTLFNSKESSVKIFENDVYKKPISLFTGKHYIVADYNSEYTFNNFYVVNIVNGQKSSIRSYDDISFDSYIEGAVKGNVYLFDKDANKQYKISLKYENVEEVGNKDNIKYYNGKWGTMTLSEALNEKKFENYHANIKGYDKADKYGNNYYLYKKENDNYIVYRTDKHNKKLKTYLFKTNDLNSIIYLKDKIYFRSNNDFCYYSNKGTRKILTNTELEFNEDISLGVYEK